MSNVEAVEAVETTGPSTANDAAAKRITHPLQPIFDEHSRVLVLGTMPSPQSRAVGFYYGHPQNRFWKVLAMLFGEPLATSNDRRTDQVLRHHIALWDVLESCTIRGASDASIADAVPNDLTRILDVAPIEAIFCTGAKAAELYARYCEAATGVPAVKLPSTSPANAAVSLSQLVEAYRSIVPHLHEPAIPTLDVPAVVQLEREIAESGTPLAELMDRAGLAIAHRAHTTKPDARVLVLCGNGNNGGDGWVAARDLARWGHSTTLVTTRMPDELRAQPARDAALQALPHLQADGATIMQNPDAEQLAEAVAESDVVIDSLLGTGFTGESVKAPFDEWIRLANARPTTTALVAADVPSGLNAQTGTASDPCIDADETITMIVCKRGLEAPQAAAYCGNVMIAPLAYLHL